MKQDQDYQYFIRIKRNLWIKRFICGSIFCLLFCLIPRIALAAFSCDAALTTPLNISEGASGEGNPFNFVQFSASPGVTFGGPGYTKTYLMSEGTEGSILHFNNTGAPVATCNGSTCIASGQFAGVSSVSFPNGVLPPNAVCNVTPSSNCTQTITNGNTLTATTGQIYTSVTLNAGATLSIRQGAGSDQNNVTIKTLILNGTNPNPSNIIFTLNNASYNLNVGSITFSGTNDIIITKTNTIGRLIVCNPAVTINQPVNWNTGGNANQFMFYASGACGQSILGISSAFGMNGILFSELPMAITGAVTLQGAILTRSIDINGTSSKFAVTYPGTISGYNYGNITCTGPAIALATTPSCTSNCCSPVTFSVTPTNIGGTQDVGYQKEIVLSTNDTACSATTTACTSSPAGCTRKCTGAAGISGCVGDWSLVSGQGTFGAGSANSGYAVYIFSPSDTTPPVFSLNYPSGGTPNILIYEQNRCPIFLPDVVPTAVTFVAGSETFTWGGIATQPVGGVPLVGVTLTATKAATCGGGTDTSYTGCKALKFSSSYNNPTTGTVAVVLTAPSPDPNASCTPLPSYPVSLPTSGAPSSAVINVKFTNGVGTLPNVTYNDVGQITLNVIDTGTGGITCGSFCSSPATVFQPQKLVMSLSQTNPGCSTAPFSGSSCSGACGVFTQAGSPFSGSITAQIGGGGIAPNFGNETTQQVPTLQSSVIAPAGGSGTVTPGTLTFAGSGTGKFNFSNASFSDVGAISMNPNLNPTGPIPTGVYLGTTLPASATTSNTVTVGRFQPHHFAISSNSSATAPQFSANCSVGFNYFGKTNAFATVPIVNVTAQNAQNGTTANYTGNWACITPSSMNTAVSFGQTAQTSASVPPQVTPTITSNVVNPTQSGSAGIYAFTYTGTTISLPIPSLATTRPYPGPFTPNISMTVPVQDTDTPAVLGSPNSCILSGPGAANSCASGGTGLTFTGTANNAQFVQGRLVLFNTAASNITGSIAMMPVQVQYFTNNGGYSVNVADTGCTVLSNSNPSFWCINSSTAPCTTGSPPQPVTPGIISGSQTVILPSFTAGAGFVEFGAPTAGTTTGQTNFQLLLDATHLNVPWLQSNWGTGSYANPSSQVTWGYSPGTSSRTIYEQESY